MKSLASFMTATQTVCWRTREDLIALRKKQKFTFWYKGYIFSKGDHESDFVLPLEIAPSIDSAKPGLLVGERNIAKSVTVTIPATRLDSLIFGSLRIFSLNMTSAASSIVVVSLAVISGCEAKLSSNVARK
jgi:hypothetical protein